MLLRWIDVTAQLLWKTFVTLSRCHICHPCHLNLGAKVCEVIILTMLFVDSLMQ